MMICIIARRYRPRWVLPVVIDRWQASLPQLILFEPFHVSKIPKRFERSKAIERLERLERTDPRDERSEAVEPFDRTQARALGTIETGFVSVRASVSTQQGGSSP